MLSFSNIYYLNKTDKSLHSDLIYTQGVSIMSNVDHHALVEEVVATHSPVSAKIDIPSKKHNKPTKTFTSFQDMVNEISRTHQVVSRKIDITTNDQKE